MNIKRLSKNLSGRLALLKNKKYREATRLFAAEGTKCVEDTLGFFPLRYLVATEQWMAEHDIRGTDARIATDAELRKISALTTPTEVIAYYEMPNPTLDESLLLSDLTLMLDNVQNPGNLGTIIRLADWFGIRQIIASPDTADVFSPKTVQATMGSLSRVNLFYRDLAETCSRYPEIPRCGLLLDGDNIYDASLPTPAFIIMGNEGNGISPQLRSMLSHWFLIPSYPPGAATGESLNVAMATAITLAEFRRRSL